MLPANTTLKVSLIDYAVKYLGLSAERQTSLESGLCFGLANAAMLYASLGRTADFLQSLDAICKEPQQPTLAKHAVVEACLHLQSVALQTAVLQEHQSQQPLTAANVLCSANHSLKGLYVNTSLASLNQLLDHWPHQRLTGVIVKVPHETHVMALLPTPHGWYMINSENNAPLKLTPEELSAWQQRMPGTATVSLLLASTTPLTKSHLLVLLPQQAPHQWQEITPWPDCFGKTLLTKCLYCSTSLISFRTAFNAAVDNEGRREATLAYHIIVEHEREHQRNRNTKGKWLCPAAECKKLFESKAGLIIHISNHTGEKPFNCHQCGKMFRSRGQLSSHLNTHFNFGKKKFPCEKCGKEFLQKGNLTVHMLTHFDVKPYKCDLCGLAFSQKGNLKKHQERKKHQKKSLLNATSSAIAQPSTSSASSQGEPAAKRAKATMHESSCPARHSAAACFCQDIDGEVTAILA